MPNDDLMAHLLTKEQDILALVPKLVEFLRAERVDPHVGLGCLAHIASHLTSYLINDLTNANAVRATAEQIAGVFLQAIAYPTNELLKKKFNESLDPDDDPDDNPSVLSNFIGHS